MGIFCVNLATPQRKRSGAIISAFLVSDNSNEIGIRLVDQSARMRLLDRKGTGSKLGKCTFFSISSVCFIFVF